MTDPNICFNYEADHHARQERPEADLPHMRRCSASLFHGKSWASPGRGDSPPPVGPVAQPRTQSQKGAKSCRA
eukprot:3722601-Pyramimonas_sp.AAC.1